MFLLLIFLWRFAFSNERCRKNKQRAASGGIPSFHPVSFCFVSYIESPHTLFPQTERATTREARLVESSGHIEIKRVNSGKVSGRGRGTMPTTEKVAKRYLGTVGWRRLKIERKWNDDSTYSTVFPIGYTCVLREISLLRRFKLMKKIKNKKSPFTQKQNAFSFHWPFQDTLLELEI